MLARLDHRQRIGSRKTVELVAFLVAEQVDLSLLYQGFQQKSKPWPGLDDFFGRQFFFKYSLRTGYMVKSSSHIGIKTTQYGGWISR